MIDHKTIIELKNKNEAAFEYVYHKTKRGVYAMIFSIVKSHFNCRRHYARCLHENDDIH
jgi:hypothetical protein